MSSFLILRMWFGKAVQDFNLMIAAQGSEGPKLIADTGNAFTSAYSNIHHLLFCTILMNTFTVIWVAYAFSAVPIIISLTKLNVLTNA